MRLLQAQWACVLRLPWMTRYRLMTIKPKVALEHVAPLCSHTFAGWARKASSRCVDGTNRSGPVPGLDQGAIPPASLCSGSGARGGTSDDRRLPPLPISPRQQARKGIRQVALTVTHLYLKSASSTCQTRVGIRSNLDSVRESSGDRHLADLSRGGYSAISFQSVFCELACGGAVPLPEFGSRRG
jgi:hypothetical protein